MYKDESRAVKLSGSYEMVNDDGRMVKWYASWSLFALPIS